MKYVIIGAGPAGVRAAETLREEDSGASTRSSAANLANHTPAWRFRTS